MDKKHSNKNRNMKNKTLLLNCSLLFALSVFTSGISNAQMVGTQAFLKGTNVEIGLSGPGGFEGTDTVLAMPLPGMHYRSNTQYFGFVANPQLNAWATYDGDFFTPGSPENGWGFEIATPISVSHGNNCAPLLHIPGAITSWTHIGTDYSADWEGDYTSGTDVHFKINYLLGETDLFYTTTITITNNTAVTIPDFYYYRNLDPDNNIMLSGDYTTQNTIVSQHAGCAGCTTSVSATQSLPWSSYFEFVAVDTNWVAGYGGFSNRDASDMYNGTGFTQTVGATNFADEAIYIAYKIDSLLPSISQSFKFCTVFGLGADSCAIAALHTGLPPVAPVCTNTPAFTLPAGSPAGGTYSGVGVVSGNMFDPTVTGAGNFDVVYTAPGTTCAGSGVTTIHVDICAGIDESDLQNTVTVYPNPFTDNATVSIGKSVTLSNAEIRIYDIVGKEVRIISDIQSHQLTIDRKGLSDGMYFYKLINKGQEVHSGKLIIK
jgi:hypothetical protein